MDSWQRGGQGNRGRGRGYGRGRSDHSNNFDNFDDRHNGSNANVGSSIVSRLGSFAGQDHGDGRDSAPRNDARGQGNQSFRGNNRGRGRGRGRQPGGFGNETMEVEVGMEQGGGNGVLVTISGYPDCTAESMKGFLERKTKGEVTILKIEAGNGSMYATVPDDMQATRLCRINGFTFGGKNLSVTRPNGVVVFLNSRWNADFGELNLDNLPKSSHKINEVIGTFLNIAYELFGSSVTTISFANNKLWNVKPLLGLEKEITSFPNLQNLSLEGNAIKETSGLDYLKGELPALKNLILRGNPLEKALDPHSYQSEVQRRFPSLITLDGQPLVQTAGQFVGQAGGHIELPATLPSYFDSPILQGAAQGLLKYFELFDSGNRSQLSTFYDPNATLSINADIALDALSPWRQGQRVTQGNTAIIDRLSRLPHTIHDHSSFVADGWQHASPNPGKTGILFLTMHGRFREASGAVLSFDRVYMLKDQPLVIKSESLIIRP